MANTATCTINGQHWEMDYAAHVYDKEYAYAGVNAVVDAYSYFVYCLKFTTPDFVGKSSKISIKLSISKVAVVSPNLRYALCTSDANYKKYYYTEGAVTDSYQIASGDKTLSNLTSNYQTYTFDISTASLQPNNTYYFYLWGYNQAVASGGYVKLNTIANHSITVTYDGSAVIYIDNGSKFEAYEIWIDNGSKWEQYAAYIDNGSSWEKYS